MGVLNFIYHREEPQKNDSEEDDLDFQAIFEIEDLKRSTSEENEEILIETLINKPQVDESSSLPSSESTMKTTERIQPGFIQEKPGAVTPDELIKGSSSLDEFEQNTKISYRTAVIWNNKGVVLSRLGDYSGAIEAYNQALLIDSSYSSAWNNKGVALSKLGRYAEAVIAYDRALMQGTDYSSHYSGLSSAESHIPIHS